MELAMSMFATKEDYESANYPAIPTSEMMHAGYVRLQQPDLKGNEIACYECGEIYKAMREQYFSTNSAAMSGQPKTIPDEPEEMDEFRKWESTVDAKAIIAYIDALRLALSAERGRAEKAEADAKRIDFMESKNCTVYKSMGGQYWVFVDETTTRKGIIGKTIREAIDAAMGAQ